MKISPNLVEPINRTYQKSFITLVNHLLYLIEIITQYYQYIEKDKKAPTQ